MSVARVTEIIASSKKSFDDAVGIGIARSAKTPKNVEGAWIQYQKVLVDSKSKISEYRVTLKVLDPNAAKHVAARSFNAAQRKHACTATAGWNFAPRTHWRVCGNLKASATKHENYRRRSTAGSRKASTRKT